MRNAEPGHGGTLNYARDESAGAGGAAAGAAAGRRPDWLTSRDIARRCAAPNPHTMAVDARRPRALRQACGGTEEEVVGGIDPV